MLRREVGRCPVACQGGAGLEKPRSVRKAQSKERKGARVKQSRTGRQSLKWFIQKTPQNLGSVFRYDAAPTSRGSPGRGRWPRAANSHNHGPVSNQPQQHRAAPGERWLAALVGTLGGLLAAPLVASAQGSLGALAADSIWLQPRCSLAPRSSFGARLSLKPFYWEMQLT